MIRFAITAAVLASTINVAAAQQRPTAEQSAIMDKYWRDTTMTRSPDPHARQPPISPARPGAAYNGWGSGGPAFGSGDVAHAPGRQ